jgi:hypothetical protein
LGLGLYSSSNFVVLDFNLIVSELKYPYCNFLQIVPEKLANCICTKIQIAFSLGSEKQLGHRRNNKSRVHGLVVSEFTVTNNLEGLMFL